MPQERLSRNTGSEKEVTTADTTDAQAEVAERKDKLDDDVDAILDEIDDVLETNAEDFVKSYIQKGGQ